jgi:hypothetical protein
MLAGISAAVPAGRAEADVAGREHLGRELAERLAELAAEERAAERGDHRLHRAELGLRLLGTRSPMAPTMRPAIGSHSFFHTSRVL